MESGSPCVTPSRLNNNSSEPLTIRGAQPRYVLKTKREQRGHKILTFHSNAAWLRLLNALEASTSKTPYCLPFVYHFITSCSIILLKQFKRQSRASAMAIHMIYKIT